MTEEQRLELHLRLADALRVNVWHSGAGWRAAVYPERRREDGTLSTIDVVLRHFPLLDVPSDLDEDAWFEWDDLPSWLEPIATAAMPGFIAP